VKRELDSTVLEFSYFRRMAQQSINDAARPILARTLSVVNIHLMRAFAALRFRSQT
jgi:hypothetical protein